MGMTLNNLDDVKLFNTVRGAMTTAFQERIPEATKDNIAQIGTMLTSAEYEAEFNQWQTALINRIGLQLFESYTLTNPLSKYIFGEMSYGDAIEIIATDIVTGRAMDYGEEGKSIDPFIKVSPQAKAEYHKIDEPIQYQTTLELDRIKRAFTQSGGLTRLMTEFVNKLYSSANVDTWTMTKNIMADYILDKKSPGMPLQTNQVKQATAVTDERSAKDFILTVKNIVSSMRFPNNLYNPQKIHKTLDNRDLVCFIRYDILNTVGVEAMASAFNPEQLNMNVTFEPMDDFGAPNDGTGNTDDVLAVIAEKNWLLITHQFEDMESIRNPRGRYINYFLTRQMSYGCNYFKDCIIIKERA